MAGNKALYRRLKYQYAYDKMDNITAKQTERCDYDYGNDDLYRLTNAESP